MCEDSAVVNQFIRLFMSLSSPFCSSLVLVVAGRVISGVFLQLQWRLAYCCQEKYFCSLFVPSFRHEAWILVKVQRLAVMPSTV